MQPDDVADLDRSCERRPKPPQMCQLNSMSSCAIKVGFSLMRVVKSSPRWKTLTRSSGTSFLLGGLALIKGKQH
jgi:hypothetical protein